MDAKAGPRRPNWTEGALLLASLTWLAVIWLWKAAPLALPVDDAHYYFVIAKNLAAGQGMTFDGLEPTNGVHPLWLALLVPLAALFGSDMDIFVRVVLSIQVLLVAGAVLSLGQSRVAPWLQRLPLAMALLLPNPYFAKVVINGQEAALAFAGACACWLGWARAERRPESSRGWLILGVLTGLLPLARLEGLVMSVAIWILVAWRARFRSWGMRWGWGAVVAMLLPLAWWSWSWMHWGHALPVSALIKASGFGGLRRGEAFGLSLAWAAVLLAAAAHWGRRSSETLRELTPLGLWVSGVVIAQWLVVRSLLPLPWYWAPALLLVASLLAQVRLRRLASAGAFLLALAIPCWHYRLDPLSFSTYAEGRAAGEWLKQHTPPGARAAGWDCGFVAAYSDRPVSNLEGLVSSLDYKERYLEPRQVEVFLREHDIRHLAQYYPEWWLESIARGEGDGLLEGGVPAAAWHVAAARCFWARRVVAPNPRKYWYFVLSQDPSRPNLVDFARALDDSPDRCAEAPSPRR